MQKKSIDKLLTSLQNESVKYLVRLRERRERDLSGKFLIEGYRELKRAFDAGQLIEKLFFCPELFLGQNEKRLISCSGASCIQCSPAVFHKISYRDRPDGLLALAVQQNQTLTDLSHLLNKKKKPFLLIAESIEKPGNLGTILRSCDAAGVDAVIVCDPTTDIHNPNVVRSSVGTLFTVPVIQASSHETLQFLSKRSISVVAATPGVDREYTELDLTVPLAIAVGTEQYGLSPVWLEKADLQARIPMMGVADSLNVASATTLLLYEVLRQRRHSLS